MHQKLVERPNNASHANKTEFRLKKNEAFRPHKSSAWMAGSFRLGWN